MVDVIVAVVPLASVRHFAYNYVSQAYLLLKVKILSIVWCLPAVATTHLGRFDALHVM